MNKRKKRLLVEFIDFICEGCGEEFEKSEDFDIHRINRNYMGGKYELRNIKVLCKNCHKKYHGNEFKHIKSK